MLKFFIKLTLFCFVISLIFAVFYRSYMLSTFLFILIIFFIYLRNRYSSLTESNHFNKRIIVMKDIVLFLIILIVFRLIQVQIFYKESYRKRATSQSRGYTIETGKRGNILDANGKQLAFIKRDHVLVVDPSVIHENDDDLLNKLKKLEKEKIVKLEKDTFVKIENDYLKGRRYRIVSKKISDEKVEKIKQVFSKRDFSEKKVFFETNSEREYFNEEIYKRIIGEVKFTSNSKEKKVGISGIEKQYEDYLKGKEIKRSKLYGRGRSMILPISEDGLNADLNGRNIYLTIDSDVNYILNEEVKNRFKETNSEEAYGIIMEPSTGRILALASYSKFKHLANRNQIFQNQYEPGSIFKPIIVAAALNEKLISEDTTFNVGDGTIKKGNHTIKEASRSTRGILTTKEVIKKSSNVGMVLIGDKFSDKLFSNYLDDFGLYDKTYVDFPNEITPKSEPYTKWHKLKRPTMSFGQGIALTPIQMITAFSAVINGGSLYKPYLVEKITDSEDIVIRRNTPKKVRDIISSDVSEIMKHMLEDTVSEGTGKRGRVLDYRVGGKTGTGQISGKGGYLKGEYFSSFIGFFPVEDPQYAVLVMFLKPKSDNIYGTYGASVAAPVFGNIAKRVIKSKSILSKNVSTFSKLDSKDSKTINKKVETSMPNLTGLSLKDVFEIFEGQNIDIKVEGVGLVDKQYPNPGDSILDIKEIKLLLKY